MCYRMSEISRHPVVAATRALRFADHVTKRNEGSGNENDVLSCPSLRMRRFRACALEPGRRFVTERGKKKKKESRNFNPGRTAWVTSPREKNTELPAAVRVSKTSVLQFVFVHNRALGIMLYSRREGGGARGGGAPL